MSRFAKAENTPIMGDMVVMPDARVGLVMAERHVQGLWRLGVQFVNNGPLSWRAPDKLRLATWAEIKAAGLYGVGCNAERVPA